MSDITLKLNDVYHFYYHPRNEQGFDARQWCFEGLLIVKPNAEGVLRLVDTYWGLNGHDNKVLTLEDALTQGVLTCYCNLEEIEKAGSDSEKYYAAEDLFRLHEQHSCSVYWYKRKGATRSKTVMMAGITEKIDEKIRRRKYLKREIIQCRNERKRINQGDLTVYL